ncbi:MAG TPA: response regulator [Candidatus Ozemobacteraceae bacterium]
MDSSHHVPEPPSSAGFPWQVLEEHSHIGAILPNIAHAISLMAEGVIDALCRNRPAICWLSPRHANALRSHLDHRQLDHEAAAGDGRLVWIESEHAGSPPQALMTALRRPGTSSPLLLVLHLWPEPHRKPAAVRGIEAALDSLAAPGKARVMCFHPIASLSKAALVTAMDAHHQLWFEERLRDNPFHLPFGAHHERSRETELYRRHVTALRGSNSQAPQPGMDVATAHELNNLLAAIIGNTEMLQLAIPPGSTVCDQLRMIHDAARKAAQISRRLPSPPQPEPPASTPTPPPHIAALPPEQSKKPIPGRLAEAWRGWGTVLLVDDEEAIRLVGQQILERLGFEVLTACDGAEAVERFSTSAKPVRAVILDLLMPRMNGEQAFMEIRNLRQDQPIVIASGLGAEEIRLKFPKDPYLTTLPKPFGIIELIQALKTLLDEPERRMATVA